MSPRSLLPMVTTDTFVPPCRSSAGSSETAEIIDAGSLYPSSMGAERGGHQGSAEGLNPNPVELVEVGTEIVVYEGHSPYCKTVSWHLVKDRWSLLLGEKPLQALHTLTNSSI